MRTRPAQCIWCCLLVLEVCVLLIVLLLGKVRLG